MKSNKSVGLNITLRYYAYIVFNSQPCYMRTTFWQATKPHVRPTSKYMITANSIFLDNLCHLYLRVLHYIYFMCFATSQIVLNCLIEFLNSSGSQVKCPYQHASPTLDHRFNTPSSHSLLSLRIQPSVVIVALG